MTLIGSLGEINFIVSADKIRTFSNLTRSGSSRFAEIEVLGRKPVVQHMGPANDVISLEVYFDQSLGLDVRYELDRVTTLQRAGKPMVLSVGNKKLGRYMWVIESYDAAWEVVDGAGTVVKARVTLNLKEYTP